MSKARRADTTSFLRLSTSWVAKAPRWAGRPTRGSETSVCVSSWVIHTRCCFLWRRSTPRPSGIPTIRYWAAELPVSGTTSPELRIGSVTQPEPGTPLAYGLTVV